MPSQSRTAALLLAGAAALGIAGCSTLPKEAPVLPAIPETWVGAPDAPAGSIAPDWWRAFKDPTLDALVAEALESGPDVRLALLRVAEARALSRQTLTQFVPDFSAQARGQYTRVVDGPELAGSFQSFITGGGGPVALEQEQMIGSIGPQVSWEIPLFQRVQAASFGSRANQRIAQEDVRAVRIALAADVAGAYVDLRAAQQRDKALREAVGAADRLAGIQETGAKAGLVAEADAADARRLAESARARLSDSALEIARAAGVLSILRGRAPGTEPPETLRAILAETEVPRYPLVGAPLAAADLVRARPDVALAEARAALAAAEVGVARADLLPQIRLTGFLGVSDNLIGSPLPERATQLELTPLVSIPIFDFGQRLAAVRVRDARLDAAMIGYQTTVNAAVGEASNALIALNQAEGRRAAATRAEAAAARAAEGFAAAQSAGIASLSERLRADQQLIDARIARIEADAAHARAAIAVQRAFGSDVGAVSPPAQSPAL